MKIKMITLQAGPAGVREPSSVHDVPVTEAEALIAGGYAMKVEKESPLIAAPKVEMAESVEAQEEDVPEVESAERSSKNGNRKAVKSTYRNRGCLTGACLARFSMSGRLPALPCLPDIPEMIL